MAVMYSIVEGDHPALPESFSRELRDMYHRMLDKDPHMRPSAHAILQEPFLQRRMEV